MINKRSKRAKDALWLENYDACASPKSVPREHSDTAVGSHGGWDTTHRPAIEAGARKCHKNHKDSHGMHYSTDKVDGVNQKIKNAKGYKGNEVFGKLTYTGIIIRPFSDRIRALYRFLLVYYGYSEVYKEFRDGEDNA